MAVIALMEQEFVRKRRLIPLDEFVTAWDWDRFWVRLPLTWPSHRLPSVRRGRALLSAGAFLVPSITLVIILSDLYFATTPCLLYRSRSWTCSGCDRLDSECRWSIAASTALMAGHGDRGRRSGGGSRPVERGLGARHGRSRGFLAYL